MGQRIKELRKAKGWSQTSLGEKIGMTYGGVAGLEADRSDPSKKIIIKLSEVFEVSTDYLLTGKEGTSEISSEEREVIKLYREDGQIRGALKNAIQLKKQALNQLGNYKQPEDSVNTNTVKIMKVELYLQVENNSKFVRGKSKIQNEIELFILNRFAMEKLDGYKYILSIPYTSNEELDSIIYNEILAEAEQTADMRNCFIEADVVAVDDPERRW